MWRLKYLIIGMLPAAIVGVALYFLAPAMADELREAVRDSAQEAVQDVFADEVQGTVEPGQVVITEADLARVIGDSDSSTVREIDGIDVIIEDGQVRIVGQDDNDEDSVDFARATPAIENGKFVLNDRAGLLTLFKSARDVIADEIELQVERLFERSGVVPVSVTAEDGRIVIVTEPAETATGTVGDPSPTSASSSLGLRTPTPVP